MSDSPAPPPDPANPYQVQIMRNAMTPRTEDDGASRQIGPYKPVLRACDLCPARCCYFSVKVSLPDAIDFCQTLGLPFFAALTLVPSSLPRAFRIERDPRIAPSITEWSGSAEIALRRKDDGSCQMLINLGGYARCGAYDARPSTCRLYPLTWDATVARGSPGALMCPYPYAVTDAAERRFVADVTRSIDRWALHDRVLAEWHAEEPTGGRTVDAFLAFAIPRAAGLMGVSVGSILAPGNADQRLHGAMVHAGVIKG